MLELIFQGFLEWTYGLILECWEYFSSVLFDLMSLDFAYLETHMPIITTIRQIMLGVGWALLLGNLVFQAMTVLATRLPTRLPVRMVRQSFRIWLSAVIPIRRSAPLPGMWWTIPSTRLPLHPQL